METENKNKSTILIVVGLILAIALFGLVLGLNWGKPFIIILAYYMATMVGVGILATIIGIVVWFFKPHRKDMLFIAKQRIIQACQSCAPDFMQSIWFRGESELESRFIGYVMGICRLSGEDKKQIEKDTDTHTERLEKITEGKELYLVAFKKSLGFAGWFCQTEVIIAYKEDLTDLNMDKIFIKDICFAPKIFDLLVPAKHYKDTHTLDEPVKNLIYRYTLQENLVEMKEITADYLQISPQYQKERQMSKAQELQALGVNNNGGNK